MTSDRTLWTPDRGLPEGARARDWLREQRRREQHRWRRVRDPRLERRCAIGHVVTSHFARSEETGATPIPITSTTAGSLLVLVAAWFQNEAAIITGVTGGGTWASTTIVSGDANSHAQIWYVPNVSGGVTSVVPTFNDDGTPTVSFEADVLEFSGVVTSSPLDISVGNSGTNAAPLVVSGALALSDEVLIGVALHTGADTTWAVDVAGGYTQISENEDNDLGQTYSSQFKIVASGASDQADWTLGASRDWFARLVSFKGTAPDVRFILGTH